MKNFVLLFAVVLLSSACVKKVQGTFETKEAVTLNGKNGSILLEEGTYASTLKLKKKKKFTLEVYVNGSKRKAEFRVPKGLRIPRRGGQLRLRSSELGQPVDLAADVITDRDPSEVRYATESCSRSFYRTICTPRRIPRSCRIDDRGRRICRPARTVQDCRRVRRVIYGTRLISYRNVNEVTSFDFTILSPEDQTVLGTFKGEEYDSQRQILDYGTCRLRGPIPPHFRAL